MGLRQVSRFFFACLMAEPASSSSESSVAAAPEPKAAQGAIPSPESHAAAPAVAESAAASADFTSIRDAAKQYGLTDLASLGDDHEAFQRMLLGYRQNQENAELVRIAQQVLPHWDKVQAVLSQASAPKAEEKWFQAPAYDPRWRQLVVRDPQTGELKAAPGAPADIVQKYQAAQQHQVDFLDKFTFDPIGAIKPGIEEVARAIAEKMIGEKMGGYQDQVNARQFVEQNSAWLHQRDDKGQLILDPLTQRAVLSQWGRKFADHVGAAQQMGMNQQAQQEYALALVQRDYALSQHAGSPEAAAAAQNKANEEFLERSQRRQAARPPGNAAEVPQPAVPLRDRLMKKFKEGGFSLSDGLPVRPER